MKKWRMTCAAALISTAVATPSFAGITFGGEWMTSWLSCELLGVQPLSHTDNQISQWRSYMISFGHTSKWIYANDNVWASDLSEDTTFGGQDNLYGDAVTMFGLSSHGSAPTVNGLQEYRTPSCHKGTMASPTFSAENAVLGEKAYGYASPNPGSARYLMFLTCNSVDTKAGEQWQQSFWYGLDVVMGYRGLSADASTTEEVGADMATMVWYRKKTFKSSWFYAIEDWAVDDTGALIVGGTDANAAAARRDSISGSTAARPSSTIHYYVAWAWHEG
jgi:hypothetical protein